ncbi:antibiotic biosynthesis monooxygenase family protein [Parenemella sanctibonifatiensis]|uniref:Antibiotic biosynthesis monooxygenase n=1 Tax=Parenemella sanctibonifatiensis TaxID=2016505 RepID=A0A255EGY3_9ACTN|nr:antibiotic biosynthesis monooxygenase family protein [Parenemella sanctibonifatiensis]OYN90798.1 antibiotic biosynthesis monooxygenase [Parenemella sanctibonifatiensis]
MIAVVRFQVPEAGVAEFRARTEAAIAVLEQKPGLRSIDFGRNVDDPQLWTLTSRWQDVGSYRRALGGYESKMAVVPLLSLAIDEPTAYEDPDEVGPNLPRGSQLD